MRTKILFFLSVLVFTIHAQTTVLGVDTIWKSGPINKRINLVIMGDGYTSSEMALFSTDVTNIFNYMFTTPPFSYYKNYFNVFAIKCASPQSGVTHPGTATDVTEPASPIYFINNSFDTRFDNFNTHRLIYSNNSAAIYNVTAGYFPNYDQLVILGNSPEYGGAGGAYAVSSTNSNSREIVMHELGHSFAGLADEYWAGPSYATEKPNMTADNNPGTVKWTQWMGINSIGTYPYTSTSPGNAWFRPHQNCKMRFLNSPFCSVCKETIIEKIHDLTNPIDSYKPTATTITYSNSAGPWYKIKSVKPEPNTLQIQWDIDGTVLGTNVDSVQVLEGMLHNGTNYLTVNVIDTTTVSKSIDPHMISHNYRVIWGINYSNVGITEIVPQIEYHVFPNPTSNVVSVKYNLLKDAEIGFSVVDINGKTVMEIKSKTQQQGEHQSEINISSLPSGNYFLSIHLNNQNLNNKFVILK